MKLTITNGSFDGNGLDGLNLSGNIKAHLENISACDNGGHGAFLMGDGEVEIVNLDANNNKKSGISAVSFEGIKEEFPYLQEAEDQVLLEAAIALRGAYPDGTNDPDQIKAVIEESKVWEFIKNQQLVNWLNLAAALAAALIS